MPLIIADKATFLRYLDKVHLAWRIDSGIPECFRDHEPEQTVSAKQKRIDMYVSLKIAGVPTDAIGRLHAVIGMDGCKTDGLYSTDRFGKGVKLPCARIRKSELDEGNGTYTVTIEVQATQSAKSCATEKDRPGQFFPQDLVIFAPLRVIKNIFNSIDERLFPIGHEKTESANKSEKI